ncbi:MAG: hypothetical protein IJ997_04220 [Mycoplasmataceae bacterium]|nr:hypothetical protein [Mycoplasmataceae bacterium]
MDIRYIAIGIIIIILIVVIIIVTRESSSSNTPEEPSDTPTTEPSNTPTTEPSNTPEEPSVNITCEVHNVNNILNTNEILFIVNVKWTFWGKSCNDVYTSYQKNEDYHTGIIPMSFVCTLDNIESAYNNFKQTIPTKVFEQIHNDIDTAYGFTGDCVIKEEDIKIDYPNWIKGIYNDNYLIVFTNKTSNIEIYSKEYKYNYLNNSNVTFASKSELTLNTINNNLYAISFGVEYGKDIPVYQQYKMTQNEWINECKNTAEVSYKNIYKISQLYDNKYLNFAIILYAVLHFFDGEITVNNLSIKIDSTSVSHMDMLITDKPYCKGIYTYNDLKDSVKDLCPLVKTFKQIYKIVLTIDLNENYNNIITYKTTDKDINLFTSGNPIINLPEYKNISSINLPSFACKKIN